jgi:hypothetical protein
MDIGSRWRFSAAVHHAAVAFGDVIRAQHCEIGEEAQHGRSAAAADYGQTGAACVRGLMGRRDAVSTAHMEREAFGQDGIVTSFEPCDQTRWLWPDASPREIGSMTSAAQHSLHLAGPVFLLDLDQRLEFAQMWTLRSRPI